MKTKFKLTVLNERTAEIADLYFVHDGIILLEKSTDMIQTGIYMSGIKERMFDVLTGVLEIELYGAIETDSRYSERVTLLKRLGWKDCE